MTAWSHNDGSLDGCGSRRRSTAFTLFELLVVAGLVAVLAALVGLGLRAPADGAALRAGQTALAGLCDAARGSAILQGANVRLLVGDDAGDPDARLRYLQVVREDPENPGGWRSCGAGAWLPKGVCVVPPAPVELPGGADWPSSRRSTAFSDPPEAHTIDGGEAGQCRYLQFTARGTTAGGVIMLTVTRPAATWLTFDRPDLVRGLLVRPTGSFTALNDLGAATP